jgi:hypothetical protein
MQHYIGYHNAEDGGPFLHDGRFYTAKSLKPETLVGNRIWVVEGRGTPRQYRIVSTGQIGEVIAEKRPEKYRTSEKEDGLTIRFDIGEFDDPVDVTSLEWFAKLRNSLANFSWGLTRPTEPSVVKEMEATWASRGTAASSELSSDLQLIEADPTTVVTTKKRLIDARLGQGKFREALESRWQSTCAVTGCTIISVLRASHIKPWKHSNNHERLDPNNGLLLAAHIDAAFDAGIISFLDNGKMIISKQINESNKIALQLGRSLSKTLNSSEKNFLQFHRKNIFIDNRK